ncbi:ulp1 protease family, C-terminal catalytic domain-containing protein [Tanacetum coccineum]
MQKNLCLSQIYSDIVFDRKNGFGIEGVYFLSLYPKIEVASTIINLWTLVLNNEEQHRDKLSGDGNVYCHTVMMTQHSVEMGKDLEARRESFDENINIVLKQAKRKNFNDVNLIVEFPWKTTYNSHDCGVFVMRHVETYLGKGNFLQEFKKEGPGQKVQLNMLCAKYMVKILLMSFNEKKKTLLKQAQEYIKMKPKRSKVLTGNDVRVDEELLK